jgi:hypothetical protein
MFVGVTIFAVWLGWELNWIRQRRAMISQSDSDPGISAVLTEEADYYWELPRPKPFVLWLFRQPTYADLNVEFEPRGVDWRLTDEQDQEFRRLTKLFPEAHVQLNVHCGLSFRALDSGGSAPTQNPDALNPVPKDDPFNP